MVITTCMDTFAAKAREDRAREFWNSSKKYQNFTTPTPSPPVSPMPSPSHDKARSIEQKDSPSSDFKVMCWAENQPRRNAVKANVMKHFGQIGVHYVGVDSKGWRDVSPGDILHMYSDQDGGLYWSGVALTLYTKVSETTVEKELISSPAIKQSVFGGEFEHVSRLRRCEIDWNPSTNGNPVKLTPRRRKYLAQQGCGTVIRLKKPY